MIPPHGTTEWLCEVDRIVHDSFASLTSADFARTPLMIRRSSWIGKVRRGEVLRDEVRAKTSSAYS
jgi:hypothetical protein